MMHKTSTLDYIVVLKGGFVAEQGTHEELCAGDGLYRRLYDLQESQRPGGVAQKDVA